MLQTDTLQVVKKILNKFGKDYAEIVNTFEQSVRGTESMQENQKMSVRMSALEIRCKNSQFLLAAIISELHAQQIAEIEPYKNQLSQLLKNIQASLNKNDLQAMIAYLEQIPETISIIDNNNETAATLH